MIPFGCEKSFSGKARNGMRKSFSNCFPAARPTPALATPPPPSSPPSLRPYKLEEPHSWRNWALWFYLGGKTAALCLSYCQIPEIKGRRISLSQQQQITHAVLLPVTISPFHMWLVFTVSSEQSQGQGRENATHPFPTRMKPSKRCFHLQSHLDLPQPSSSRLPDRRHPGDRPSLSCSSGKRRSSSQKFYLWRGAKNAS